MAVLALTARPCPRCHGEGTLSAVNPQWCRRRRLAAKVGLRAAARRWRCSPAYLSDVEHGRRLVSPRLYRKYRALVPAKAAKAIA